MALHRSSNLGRGLFALLLLAGLLAILAGGRQARAEGAQTQASQTQSSQAHPASPSAVDSEHWPADPDSMTPEVAQARAMVKQAIRLAGGWDAWQRTRDASFRLMTTRYDGATVAGVETTQVMFRTHGGRKFREEYPNGDVVGCDGIQGWARRKGVVSTSPRDSAVACFYAGTFPYWFELPFRFLDPGVRLTAAGSVILQKHLYDVVMATFDRKHTDTYFLYFDQANGRFMGCNFTVVEAGRVNPEACSWWTQPVQTQTIVAGAKQVYYGLTTDNSPDFIKVMMEFEKRDIRVNQGLPDSLFVVPR